MRTRSAQRITVVEETNQRQLNLWFGEEGPVQTEFEVDPLFLNLADKVNSCGCIDQGKLLGIVEFEGHKWACNGSLSTGRDGVLEVDLKELIPAEEWHGRTFTYKDRLAERRCDKNALLSGPMLTDGIGVTFRGRNYVLGPREIRLKRKGKRS
jgi:hypothetical protein